MAADPGRVQRRLRRCLSWAPDTVQQLREAVTTNMRRHTEGVRWLALMVSTMRCTVLGTCCCC